MRCFFPGARLLLLASLALLALLAPARADAAPRDVHEARGQRAQAAPSRVLLVDGAPADALLREAAARLQAELGAAGFEVVRVAHAPGGDLRAEMERAAQEAGAFAAATISRSPVGATADLWIVDRVTRKTVVRTVEVGGASTPSVLAVRTVELLQASLLEASAPRPGEGGAAGGPDAQRLPDDVQRWITPARPSPGPLAGPGLEVGAVVLESLDGIGPSFGPMLRLSLGAPSPAQALAVPVSLAARLTFAGPALGPDLRGAAGTVAVHQELAGLEAVGTLDVGARIVPVFSAGLGVHHLHARGAPDAPYRGASGEVWSLAALAGAGAAVRLTGRTALLLDAQAIVTTPRPVVALAGERLGSAGRPSFAGSLGLLVRL